MPYKIEPGEDGFFVVNSETGERENKEPHATRKAAAKHMAALYANVPDAKKEAPDFSDGSMVCLRVPFAKAERLAVPGGLPAGDLHLTLAFLGAAADIPVAARQRAELAMVELTSETAWIGGVINGLGRFMAHSENGDKECAFAIYDSVELPVFRQRVIEAMSKAGVLPKQEHGFVPHITLTYVDAGVPVDMPPGLPILFPSVWIVWGGEYKEFPLRLLEGVITKELAAERLEQRYNQTDPVILAPVEAAPKGFNVLEAFKSLAQGVFDRLKKPADSSGHPVVFKDAKGRYRWLLLSSNAFRDRDDEIVSTKALQADVSRSDETGHYGPLRFWHMNWRMKGVDIGDCDYRAALGRMLLESGTFRDERIAERVKEHASKYRVSIGFTHPATEPDRNGVFHNITVFERSLVPAGRAANEHTFVTVKGD